MLADSTVMVRSCVSVEVGGREDARSTSCAEAAVDGQLDTALVSAPQTARTVWSLEADPASE